MGLPIRIVILTLVALSTFVAQMTRINLNVAIVSMTNEIVESDDNRTVREVCPAPITNVNLNSSEKTSNRLQTESPKYNWDEGKQGIVLGTFFYTYVMLQVPAVS